MKLVKVAITVLVLVGLIGFSAVSKDSADPGGGTRPPGYEPTSQDPTL